MESFSALPFSAVKLSKKALKDWIAGNMLAKLHIHWSSWSAYHFSIGQHLDRKPESAAAASQN